MPLTTPISSARTKHARRAAAEEVERQQGEDDGQRGVQRAHDRLGQAVVDDLLERLAGTCCARFSRMRSKTTIVSWTEKPITVSSAVTNRASTSTSTSNAENGEDAEDDQHVVEHRDQRADAVEERVLGVAEGIGDVEQDADRGERHREDRALRICGRRPRRRRSRSRSSVKGPTLGFQALRRARPSAVEPSVNLRHADQERLVGGRSRLLHDERFDARVAQRDLDVGRGVAG